MKFILDTNAVIALLEGNQMFANRLRTYQPSDFGMPSIVHQKTPLGALNKCSLRFLFPA